MSISGILMAIQKGVVENASHILMAFGTGCSIAGVISAAQSAPAANDAVTDAKADKCSDKLTFWEWLRAVAKFYGPAAALEFLALCCFWSAHGIDIRRQMIWAGIATTAEETLREYQRKTKELIGKDAEKAIRDEVAQDKVDRNPPPQTTYILEGSSDREFVFTCYDGSVQYFQSSYNKIKAAENDANHEMIQHMYISESEIMWLLDPDRKWLKPTPTSGEVGWNMDNLLHFSISWADGPQHLPIGVVEITDKDGFPYRPIPGYSKGL